MQSAARHLSSIHKRVIKHGFVLMLDFDGTLSPIVARHQEARISPQARHALTLLAKRVPIAIISGRALKDIRNRVRIPGISYAGCHGLELSIHGEKPRVLVRAHEQRIFVLAKKALKKVAARYPGISAEDKGLGFTLHYRGVPKKKKDMFRKEAQRAVAALISAKQIRIIDSLYAFDAAPRPGRTKGDAVRECYEALKPSGAAVPMYIGDSLTDEDAFRSFKRGVTIRVGKAAGSAAQYYFRTRKEVDRFIALLANTAPAKKRLY